MNITDLATIGTAFSDQVDSAVLIDTVVDVSEPVKDTTGGERFVDVFHKFDVEYHEFNHYAFRDFFDRYMVHSVKYLSDNVRRLQQRVGRKLEYRKFTLDAETSRKKVIQLEQDGMFLAATFEAKQEFVSVTVQARLGLAIDDMDPTIRNSQ